MHTPWIYVSSRGWCIADLDLRWNLYSMVGEERIGRNTKRPRYNAVRLRRRARRCGEDGRPTWRERISCLVKFHGTMDGMCVAVCNLQPSFNQYSRYTYGPPERFPTLENSTRGILQASYVDRSESAVEALLRHFFLYYFSLTFCIWRNSL